MRRPPPTRSGSRSKRGCEALAVPFHREADDRAEQVRAFAEAAEMVAGLVGKHLGLVAGTVLAEQADEGLLALFGILAKPLARLVLLAFDIEQIVGDLEGRPRQWA